MVRIEIPTFSPDGDTIYYDSFTKHFDQYWWRPLIRSKYKGDHDIIDPVKVDVIVDYITKRILNKTHRLNIDNYKDNTIQYSYYVNYRLKKNVLTDY